MDFCQRAQSALDRDDPARALMVLVRGLRRHPTEEEALDLFLFIYTRHIGQPGLESDLFRGLEYHDDRSAMLGLVVDELQQLDKTNMADAVEMMARERDIEIDMPPEDVDDSGDVEQLSDREDQPSGESDKPKITEEAAETEDEHRAPVSSSEKISSDGLSSTSSEAKTPEAKTPEAELEVSDKEHDEQGPSSQKGRPTVATPVRSKLFVLVAAAVAIVGTAGAVIIGGQHAHDAQQLRVLDEAMIAFDPMEPEATRSVLEEARTRRDAEIDERLWFLSALVALEQGESIEERPSSPETEETSWGLAARALEATSRGQWEAAMRAAHHLEHSYADTLPAYFVRGRICEARRDWQCAHRYYERVFQHFEEFAAAKMSAMRVAAYRFDREEWQKNRSRLGDGRPDHVYADLQWVDPFALTVGDDGNTEEQQEGSSRRVRRREDAFLWRWSSMIGVIEDFSQGDWSTLLSRCDEALSDTMWRIPAFDIVCAQAAAGAYDVDSVIAFFEAGAKETDLSPSFYRHLQILAPRILSDLGRADRGLTLTIAHDDSPFEGDEVEEVTNLVKKWESDRPSHFRPVDSEFDELSAQALLVRGQVLVALGATKQARRALAPLMTRKSTGQRARFELAWSHLVEGNRHSAMTAINQIDDDGLRQGVEAYLAYLEGRHDEAYRMDWNDGDDPRLLRVRALAFLADGRGREAMAALEEATDGIETLSLATVKQRVFARSGERRALDEVRQALPDADKTRTLDHLIDLAGSAFWRRDLARSKKWLDTVIEVTPGHPEANWKLGLVLRVEGQERQGRLHFRRAWRGDQDSTPLLVESGRVHLDSGRFERAREVFLRATLRDRQHVEAVQGLGMAYAEGDRARGRRDLVQLLGNYSARPGDGPARAEMNRWLAILHGARQGEEEAFQYLQEALDIMGERAAILVEVGLYHEARDEWEQAHEHYAKALRVNPTLPDVHFGLARVAVAQKDYERADEHIDRLLRLVPVGETREDAKQLRTELDEARR